MRITFETTTSDPQYSVKTIVEVPYDDIDLDELRQLIDQALEGFGYPLNQQENLVNEASE